MTGFKGRLTWDFFLTPSLIYRFILIVRWSILLQSILYNIILSWIKHINNIVVDEIVLPNIVTSTKNYFRKSSHATSAAAAVVPIYVHGDVHELHIIIICTPRQVVYVYYICLPVFTEKMIRERYCNVFFFGIHDARV